MSRENRQTKLKQLHDEEEYGSLRSDTPSYISYKESKRPKAIATKRTTLPSQDYELQQQAPQSARLSIDEEPQSLRQRSPVRVSQQLPPTPVPSDGAETPRTMTNREQQITQTLSDPRVRQQLEEREAKKYRPWFIWIVSAVQVVMLIVSIAVNQQLTGQLIETSPFNIMLGPSAFTLIRLGARFVPCMRSNSSLVGQSIACPLNKSGTCSLQEICGLPANGELNQWWRFIVPIFLHGGIVHIALNLIFQLTTGAQLERDFGWFRIIPIYFLSGIFGFVFGGTFGNELNPSVGCSGALFGLVAVMLIDLLSNWRIVLKPWKELFKLVGTIIVSFLFGLIPGVDNFSHIGGFFIGLITSVAVLPFINWRFNDQQQGQQSFFGTLIKVWYSYSGKVKRFILILISTFLVILFYALIFVAFYGSKDAKQLCPSCQYFGCLPIGGLCDIGKQQ